MKKRTLSTIVATLMVATMLTACGNKTTDTTATTTPTISAGATETAPTPEVTEEPEVTAPKEAVITYTTYNAFYENETYTVNFTKEPLLPYGFVILTEVTDYQFLDYETYCYDYTYLYKDMKDVLGIPYHVEIMNNREEESDPEKSILDQYKYYPSHYLDQKLPDGTHIPDSDLSFVFEEYNSGQYSYVQLVVDSFWTGEDDRDIHLHVEYETNVGWVVYIKNDTEENIWYEKSSEYAGNSIYEFTYMGEVINLATDATYWKGCPLYLEQVYEYDYCGVTQDDGIDALVAKLTENLGEPATLTMYEAIWELEGGVEIYVDMANPVIQNNRY